MNESWYMLQDGVANGPFDLSAMQAQVTRGVLRADSQVCRVGAQEWGWADADEMLRPLLIGGAVFAQPAVSWGLDKAFALSRAWRGPSWGMLVLIGLTWGIAALPLLGMASLVDLARQMRDDPSPGMLDGVYLLIQILTRLLVQMPLQASAAVIGAAAIRGDLRYTDMFVAFRRYLGVLGASMLFGLATAAAALVALLPLLALPLVAFTGGSRVIPGVAALLISVAITAVLAIFAIRWVIRYSLGTSIVCDPVYRSVGILEAFRMSAAAIRGKEGSVFLYLFVTTLLSALSILLLGVGLLLVGWPLWVCAHGAVYHLLIRSRPMPGPSAGA
jgi:hypothetical protein